MYSIMPGLSHLVMQQHWSALRVHVHTHMPLRPRGVAPEDSCAYPECLLWLALVACCC